MLEGDALWIIVSCILIAMGSLATAIIANLVKVNKR